jgi:sugar phosphate isomerase/epimerase
MPNHSTPPVSLQLWSLRDEIKADFTRTVATVAKIGYPAVELAGYGNLEARGAKAALDAAGLKVSGMHVGPPDLRSNLSQIVSDALLLETRHVVVAWWPADQFVSVAACQKIGEILNGYGETLRAFGLQLAFHNHATEFKLLEGRPAFEWVLGAAEPRNLQAEVDMYWVHVAGYSPVRFLQEQGRRVPLIHLKDQKELGRGPVDYPAIFAAAEAVGAVEWYVVEQEEYNHPPIESVRLDFEQLQRWGLA